MYRVAEFQFQADTLIKIEDRYDDLNITKDDVSFVVKERLLKKDLHQKASKKFDDESSTDYGNSELRGSHYLSRVFTIYEDIKNHIFALTDIIYTPLFSHAQIHGVMDNQE